MRVVFGKKCGGEEAIVQTGKGIIAGSEHRTVFYRFGVLGGELALGEARASGFVRIEIDRVLLARAIEHRGVAEASTPLDQVVGRNPVDGHFGGDLRKVAGL